MIYNYTEGHVHMLWVTGSVSTVSLTAILSILSTLNALTQLTLKPHSGISNTLKAE